MNEDIQIANAIYEKLKDVEPIELGSKVINSFNLRYEDMIFTVNVKEIHPFKK